MLESDQRFLAMSNRVPELHPPFVQASPHRLKRRCDCGELLELYQVPTVVEVFVRFQIESHPYLRAILEEPIASRGENKSLVRSLR